MRRPSPHNMDGEEGVALSLAISIGMICLSAVGWCLWKALA